MSRVLLSAFLASVLALSPGLAWAKKGHGGHAHHGGHAGHKGGAHHAWYLLR